MLMRYVLPPAVSRMPGDAERQPREGLALLPRVAVLPHFDDFGERRQARRSAILRSGLAHQRHHDIGAALQRRAHSRLAAPVSLAAIDLLAWTRVLLLDGELAAAEPKKLRYRLLHVAARITRGGRRLHLRISATWPWRHELAAAFHRLTALPRPAS